MSVQGFFRAAVEHAETLLLGVELRRLGAELRREHGEEGPACAVLDRALTRAMVDSRRGRTAAPRWGLRPGEGVQARARLLVGSAHLSLNDPTMQPGESVGEWLDRGIREVRHDQILPLLRAAARARRIGVKDLEARAR